MNPPTKKPTLSVVIPARNCKEDLRHCLDAIDRSAYRDFEIIVVDDASTDDTTMWIEPSQAQVLILPEQSGPGLARNRGAQEARGEYVLFLDADVCVHPDTLGRVVEAFLENPGISAVFGSYDTEPRALNVLSQYRNLMHHFVHQEANEEANTFWTGCGAIRRTTFLDLGGFHPDYRRPCIEDIELGVRLRKAGHRIRLNKDILVTHRKCWTLLGMVKADVRDRALPWSQLILREANLPNDLNLGLSHRISALLACGLVLSLLAGAWHLQIMLIIPPCFFLGLAWLDAWSLTHRVPTAWRILSVLGVLSLGALLVAYFHVLALLPLALLVGIVGLNWRFYRFLARTRQPLFAALVIPLHICYYLYSVAAFCLAIVLHLLEKWHTVKPSQPPISAILKHTKEAGKKEAALIGD